MCARDASNHLWGSSADALSVVLSLLVAPRWLTSLAGFGVGASTLLVVIVADLRRFTTNGFPSPHPPLSFPQQMDPVQKAVINHTFGVPLIKTKRPVISCNVCQIRFNSEVQQPAGLTSEKNVFGRKSTCLRAVSQLPGYKAKAFGKCVLLNKKHKSAGHKWNCSL